MKIKPCPKCGRAPKIYEGIRRDDGVRRRLCMCPKMCSVLSIGGLKLPLFVFRGDGDDNAVYSLWNKLIKRSGSAKIDSRIEK